MGAVTMALVETIAALIQVIHLTLTALESESFLSFTLGLLLPFALLV